MDLISVINIASAQDCFANYTFMDNWRNQDYRGKIVANLGDSPSAKDVLSLGSELSGIFANEGASRDQGNVSSAGNTWLRLVCWYFNICLTGTRSFATISSNLIPGAVRETMNLSFNGSSISGSKEIVIIEYAGNETPTVTLPSSSSINYRATYASSIDDFLASFELSDTRVIMVAAKTNCSDMVAVPLFWAFCYKCNKQDVFDIKVGTSKHKPEHLLDGTLKYAYVTVPTGNQARIDAGQLPGRSTLLKLGLLDGGFYWGRAANSTVKTVSDFFIDNLPLSAKYAGEAVASSYRGIISGVSPLAVLLGPDSD